MKKLFVMLALLGSAGAINASDFGGEISGSSTAFNLRADITPSVGVGNPGKIFVGALIPGAGWFFLTPAGWQSWTGGDIPAHSSGPIGPTSVQILSQTDVTPFAGTQVYVGYGSSADGMLAAGTYAALYSVGGMIPFGVRIVGNDQLPPGCTSSADQCFRDALARGTVRVLRTPIRDGDREVALELFRGATGLYNFQPVYADNLFPSDIIGRYTGGFDWIISDDTGVLMSANGRCAQILFVPPAGITLQLLASCP